MYLKGIVVSLCLLALMRTGGCDHLLVGVSTNNVMAHQVRVQLAAIPFVKRVKSVFYSIPVNTTAAIKGITATDLLNSGALASITSGGVGSTFVNVRLKSETSKALDYSVQIFT